MSLAPGQTKQTVLPGGAPPYGSVTEGDVQDNAYGITDSFTDGNEPNAEQLAQAERDSVAGTHSTLGDWGVS